MPRTLIGRRKSSAQLSMPMIMEMDASPQTSISPVAFSAVKVMPQTYYPSSEKRDTSSTGHRQTEDDGYTVATASVDVVRLRLEVRKYPKQHQENP